MNFIVLIEAYSLGGKIILGIFLAILGVMFLNFAIKMVEISYVMRKRRPLYYVHFPFFLKKLDNFQKGILKNEFRFYNNLEPKYKRYFEHRVSSFIKDKHFIGRDGLKVTEEMRILISATAVMLTFGFRDFYIGLIGSIFIYPEEFYSKTNDDYHKGEFNPKLMALVFSWSDFQKGYDVEDDNINLGIHEFTHAIHLNSIKERDVSSTIFLDTYSELTDLLSNEKTLRTELIASKYFRTYGFTNQFEFLAVIIETFIETPEEFNSRFPEVYNKIKQMLNFHYKGY